MPVPRGVDPDGLVPEPNRAGPLSDGVDPVTEAAARLIGSGGILGRQLEINESLILLDRQIRQAQLIEQLIALQGADREIEIAPGVLRSYADTPAGLRQQIAVIRLRRELEEALAPPQKTDPEAAIPLPRAMRSDGGQFQVLPGATAAAPQGTVPETDTPERTEAPSPPSPPPTTVSLRTILGNEDGYMAVFRAGQDLIEARQGSILPGGSRVLAIGPDSATILRDGRQDILSLGN